MKIAVIGAGAVGGFYGALLARQGHEVSFVARGAHRDAIRSHGLRVVGPLGDFTVQAQAASDPSLIGPVDVVLHTVKTYDNDTAIPLIKPLLGPNTFVLTLQNGVDSAEQIAEVAGEKATLGGSAYIASAIEGPGLIRQTGTHRRIVFGEYFNPPAGITPRVQKLADAMAAANIVVEAVVDSRHTIWEKFTYLAPFAAFTGAARLPIGPLWSDDLIRSMFLDAVVEVANVARAHGIKLPADHRDRVFKYAIKLPPSTRSSLLIDLQSRKRIEVEALQGSVVRRGARVGVPTPIMSALYAVLKPHAGGPVQLSGEA
ncbi:MAG TPA: 2-dehydropantoate 2-reductase [Vicinamibacterales bacterium]|nr:2-dehydropantoate 2-reductase [Vicinamibacterales bacterium]